MDTIENPDYCNTSEINQAASLALWNKIVIASENQQIIQGQVERITKQGFIVDFFGGIKAFLPSSQIEIKKKPDRGYNIIGKTMDFKIVKIDYEKKSFVVSHRIILEEELKVRGEGIWATIKKDQIFEGAVKNITSYGVFINLGGVDGLLHISEICWEKIDHPNEKLELGQKIKIVVLNFNYSQRRIWLGRKQLLPNPWDTRLDSNLKAGDKIKGKIISVKDYGAFLEILPGIHGLIHISEMPPLNDNENVQDVFKKGDEVEAIILDLNREKRKMSLGIK